MRLVPRFLLVHLLHAGLLLLPTILGAQAWWRDPVLLVFVLEILVIAFLEGAAQKRYAGGDDRPVQDRGAMRVAAFVGLSLLVTFWMAQVEYRLTNPSLPALQVSGAVLLVLGISLRVGAIRTLGTRFVSDIQVEGSVAREGIYAYLRHPSEVGLLLIAAGAPLLLGAWITTLAAMSILGPISLWRMRREDAALAAFLASSAGS